MKQPKRTLTSVSHLLILFLAAAPLFAQGYDTPLTIQGLDHNSIQSATSRALGGTTIGVKDDVGLMFSNPASLQSINGIQISLGGVQQYLKSSQVQQSAPYKFYSNLSLLLEGLTGYIPDVDTVPASPNPGDVVQRPFDNIGPNWVHRRWMGLPLQVCLGVPVTIGRTRLTVGVGAVQYADVSGFYQNNNVFSPSILSERPLPIHQPSDSNPFFAEWYQYTRSREGEIHGYGGSLAASLPQYKIDVGVSALILKGTTTDYEARVGRGFFTFQQEYFQLDSVFNGRNFFGNFGIVSGTSDYSGAQYTMSAIYRGEHITLGVSATPPTTITRKFSRVLLVDTTGVTYSTPDAGEEKIRLPWRGTVGFSLGVLPNLSLALEYEFRSFQNALYTDTTGNGSNPWLSSNVVHVGAEYLPYSWMALRMGMRGQSEVFETAGNPLPGEPVSYTIYSAGLGFNYMRARLNVTYEYAQMKYQDLWAGAISLNNNKSHTIIADLSYEIPW